MQNTSKHCPECGGILFMDDQPGVYQCQVCRSLHEVGKPLYTYYPAYAFKQPVELLEIK